MINRRHYRLGRANGFTLVELLVAIAIVGLLSSIVLVAMSGVTENARNDRTRAQIARIHTLIAQKWEEFEDTRVNISNLPGGRGDNSMWRARYVVDAKRELMRMTLPERKDDLLDGLHLATVSPKMANRQLLYAGLTNVPSEWNAYRRKARRLVFQHSGRDWDLPNGWTRPYEDAECLYLILSQMVDGDRAALEFFRENEIGDFDDDGMPEILDAWGNPIRFLRWAPGFSVASEYAPKIAGLNVSVPAGAPVYSTEVPGGIQNVDTPDPFDPLELYTRYPQQIPRFGTRDLSAEHKTFALFPLVISAGGDKSLDMLFDFGDGPVRYAAMSPPNNPYVNTFNYVGSIGRHAIGIRADTNNNGRNDFADNIHNHLITTGR